jgi:hypothetical protein
MFSKKQPPAPERRVRNPQRENRPNTVFSYHANRSVRETNQLRDAAAVGEQEAEQQERRRNPKLPLVKRLQIIFVTVLVIVVASLSFQLSSKVAVVPVGSSASQLFLQSNDIYAEAAQKEFSSVWDRNKLTVDANKIGTNLQKKFPELKVVSVSLPVFGSRPKVYVQAATPRLVLATNNSGTYVLDSSGRALMNTNQVPKLQELNLPVVTDQSGLSIQAGQVALPTDAVSFITEVVGQVQAKNVAITSLTLPQGTDELYLKASGVGYQVKFNLHGNAREEAGAFLATKQYLEGQHKTPSQYMDVRVENKVYYK